jgi:phenylacetate-CoA ligase
VIRHLVWLAGPARRERGWRAYYERYSRLATASKAEFEAWRQIALAAHLAWAQETIPYFRERVPAGAPLSGFPVLRRADVQAHAEDLRDPTRPLSELQENASGGSTGEPVRVWQDAEYWHADFATEAWLWEWWGLSPWCAKAFLWGNDLAPDEEHWKARLEQRLLSEYSLDVFRVGSDALEDFARLLERKRPPAIIGYASALELFAAHLLDRGGLAYTPQVVRSAAEALYPERRAHVEAAFGVRATDFYGSRESASLAAESRTGGFHVLAHGKVLELVDDDDQPVPPGVPGRVLVTDLTNRAFGLVRYENGDVASWASDTPESSLACPYPRLERVFGRTSDFVTLPSGERIHGEWFTHLFYGVAAITRFQVHQTALDRVTLRTVGSQASDVIDPIVARIRERLGADVLLVWEPVEEIPLTKTSKWRFTISDVSFRGETA